MDKLIRADLYRYGGLEGYRGFLKGMKIPGFRYTYFLRLGTFYSKYHPKGALARLVLPWLRYKYGFQLYLGTKIGKGLYIGHFGTLVIAREVVIGSNCNIAHNVTIGKVHQGKLKGHATIGDNVWIGTGTVIVGKINIGSNVLIAPNSFVNFDVPDNSVVIENRANIKKKINPTEGYINDVLNI